MLKLRFLQRGSLITDALLVLDPSSASPPLGGMGCTINFFLPHLSLILLDQTPKIYTFNQLTFLPYNFTDYKVLWLIIKNS